MLAIAGVCRQRATHAN